MVKHFLYTICATWVRYEQSALEVNLWKEMQRFIRQHDHVLPYFVEQGLEMIHAMASSLFSCRFPDLGTVP